MNVALALVLLTTPPTTAEPRPDAGEREEGPVTAPQPSLELWLPTPSPKPPPRGLGLIAAGAVSIALIGAPLVGTASFGIVEQRRCKRDGEGSNCSGGLLAGITMPIGIIAIVAGASLLANGVSRLKAYNAWQREHRVALRLQLARSGGAWLPGFELRF